MTKTYSSWYRDIPQGMLDQARIDLLREENEYLNTKLEEIHEIAFDPNIAAVELRHRLREVFTDWDGEND